MTTWHDYRGSTVARISGRYKSPPLPEISSRDLKVVEGVKFLLVEEEIFGFVL